jgi:hypothetical protein
LEGAYHSFFIEVVLLISIHGSKTRHKLFDGGNEGGDTISYRFSVWKPIQYCIVLEKQSDIVLFFLEASDIVLFWKSERQFWKSTMHNVYFGKAKQYRIIFRISANSKIERNNFL